MEVRVQPRILQINIPEQEIPQFLNELAVSGRPILVEWAKGIANQNGLQLDLPLSAEPASK